MTRRLHSYLRLTVICFFACQSAFAQTGTYRDLQAAYLFNFAKYIQWPAASDEFIIGVYGDEGEIDGEWQTLFQNRRVSGRAVVLQKVLGEKSLQQCNIIFVPLAYSNSIDEIKEVVDGRQILLVTEKDLIGKGAMISFVVEEDKLRFKLKRAALDAVGLQPSDGLLRLAIQL